MNPSAGGRWLIEWRDNRNDPARTVRETADSPEEAVAAIDRLLAGQVVVDEDGDACDRGFPLSAEGSATAALFPGVDPVVVMRRLRPGTVIEERTVGGILTVTRTGLGGEQARFQADGE